MRDIRETLKLNCGKIQKYNIDRKQTRQRKCYMQENSVQIKHCLVILMILFLK